MQDHEIIRAWYEVVNALEQDWVPHPGQREILDAIFLEFINSAFVRCGRKWGKTEIALYILWRIAKQFPNSPCFYFAPMQNQARLILWEDPRLKNFGPREWLLDGSRGISESDMVLRFKNGSFIKVDGTDNFNKYRGPRYRVAVYDEYKECDPRMRKAMRPNAAVLKGIDVFMGSPPEESGTDYEMLDKEHQADKSKRAFHEPSWRNPHIDLNWLKREKTEIYARGEGEEWEREYAAKYIRGGASLIFPMLEPRMMRPHAEVMAEIHRDRKKLQFFWWNDPAGATCFASLFVAINPYSKKVYALDEIYEKSQAEMTTKRIGARAIKIRNELHDRASSWRGGYDEAATWFLNEWLENFPDEDTLEPSAKALNDKGAGLSLIKDIMLLDLLVISDRCQNFYKELDELKKDKNGKIPKKDDHLIDDFRYILGAAFYSIPKRAELVIEADENFRGRSLESDLDEMFGDPYDIK